MAMASASTGTPQQRPAVPAGVPKELRHTQATGWRHEPGCVVAAMAMAANVSYTQARGRAANIAGYDGHGGMNFSDAKRVLSDMGVAASWHRQSGDWNSLPNRAIIAVMPRHVNVAHAVVFERDESGNEYLWDWAYDSRVPRSNTDYDLIIGDEYLHLT